jgi:glycosyltransferase involved in cell wall biosynthesis
MISIIILAKNNEKTLQKTLESTLGFEEVILVDTGSTDLSLQIARKFPHVKIFSKEFTEGFGTLRNEAASLASSDWVLMLDSDEVLSPELSQEIRDLSLDPTCVYSLVFINYYNEKPVNFSGWQKERHTRLYNRKFVKYDDSLVHEGLILEEKNTVSLKNHLYHYSYFSTEDFLRKMQIYSSLFAKQNQHKKKSSLSIAIIHSLASFIKSYLIKGGIFGGKDGFIISIYIANTTLYKYLKLEEENKKPSCS